jgi:hypothetical protein
VMEDLFVAEANNAAAVLFKSFGAGSILSLLLIVNVAVDLDDKVTGGAVEIGNKSINRMLPPKLKPGQLSVSKLLPKPFFCRGQFLPQFSRSLLYRA